MKKNNSNFIRNFIIVCGVFFVCFLVSCSSSNQMTSSFGKRKYMPGHYYDRVTSVKSKRAFCNIPIVTIPVNNHRQVKVSLTAPYSFAVTNAKVSSVNSEQFRTKKLQKSFIHPLIASPSAGKLSSLSIALVSNSITSYHDDSGYTGHHFGRKALSFLLLSVVFGILAILFAFNPSLLLVFELVAYVCFAIFIVLLILWLLSLATE